MGDVLEPVLDSGEVIVDTVGIGGIEIVIDGDEANAVLREGEVSVQSGQCGVSAQSGKVFAEDNPHLAGFHLFQHTLKAGAVIIRAAETVIHEEYRIREMMLFCILQKDGLLIFDGQGFAHPLVLLGQSAIESSDFFGCS